MRWGVSYRLPLLLIQLVQCLDLLQVIIPLGMPNVTMLSILEFFLHFCSNDLELTFPLG
jgi:hypothetical protein